MWAKVIATLGGLRGIVLAVLIPLAFFAGRATINCEIYAVGPLERLADSISDTLGWRTEEHVNVERNFSSAREGYEDAKRNNEQCKTFALSQLPDCVPDRLRR